MMDLSDGLTKDLSRMCEASGVGARLLIGAVPIDEALASGASALGVEPLTLALSGGEDYELVATMPADAVQGAASRLSEDFGVRLSDVGEITLERGLLAVDAEGRASALPTAGWDHFAPG